MERSLHKSPASGQALLEFALILPLLFLLIVNVINFGLYIYAWIAISNAARTGAQYLSQGGAMIGSPSSPTLAQVQTLVQNDLQSLPNGASSTVRVCRTGETCIGSGTQVPPAETPEPVPGGGTITYAVGSVDVTYRYSPMIPLWEFPALGVHATLPSSTMHRQAAMRILQ